MRSRRSVASGRRITSRRRNCRRSRWSTLPLPHLPATRAEMDARGWDCVDVVLVSGDAYVDHPAFAMGILGRVLEAAGFRVAILSQPDWKSADPWRTFGRPRLFFGISAGNMDSMINHYTANKKVRNDDAYSPGGRIGLRPDRATMPYCQRAREAFPGVPVIAGGVEASLRRLAHYDYWSDTVKRSILLDSKADLVVFGMGEQPIVEIARRLAGRRDRPRPPRHARRRLRPGRQGATPGRRDRPPLVRGDQGRPLRVRQGDQDHPPGNQPAQRQGPWSSTTTARPWSPTRPACRSARRTWTGSTACPTPASRTRCTRGSGSPRSRPSRIRSRSCEAASAAAPSARSRPTRGGSSSRGRRSRSSTS